MPVASICDAMGHSEAVHSRSYRTMTLGMRTRDFAAKTSLMALPESLQADRNQFKNVCR